MDWKLFFSTFAAIFVAELGDKTQLAALSLSATTRSRWVVFAGSALALVAASAIAVALGDVAAKVVPPAWMRRGAGVIFVAMGLVYILKRGD